MMKTIKCLRKGCKAYLAYVTKARELEKKEVSNIHVVCDLPDVFPDDLPGIPPERQVEFGIDLIPGATPIAKAPYRLALIEMQELMKQLQELLDKCFIQPSSSPWGAPVLFVKKKDGSMRMLNVVADALSRKRRLGSIRVKFMKITLIPDLDRKIQEFQQVVIQDKYLDDEQMKGLFKLLESDTNKIKQFKGIIWVPKYGGLREIILDEAHKSKYSIHLGSTKMYKDLKSLYWWPSIKSSIGQYVEKCRICLQVKAEHQRPYGSLKPLEIPMWKWDHITTDFIVRLPKTKKGHDAIWVIVDRLTKSAYFLPIKEMFSLEKLARLYVEEIVSRHRSWDDLLPLAEFSYNNSYHSSIKMAPFEALYGRKCKSPVCLNEVRENQFTGPDIIQQTSDKVTQIRKRIKSAQDRQKRYADRRRKPIEFQVGDKVMLKISPWKGVMRFGKRGKLSPRYIGPFSITKRIDNITYKLCLPVKLQHIHDTFYVSNLKKSLLEEDVTIPIEELSIDETLSFIKELESIIDTKIKQLRNKSIPFVKVQWRYHHGSEATWEPEVEMRTNFVEAVQVITTTLITDSRTKDTSIDRLIDLKYIERCESYLVVGCGVVSLYEDGDLL
ncbi:putative reverse transcriptase domain-containing protein [Tanacetum coccineum]